MVGHSLLSSRMRVANQPDVHVFVRRRRTRNMKSASFAPQAQSSQISYSGEPRSGEQSDILAHSVDQENCSALIIAHRVSIVQVSGCAASPRAPGELAF